MSKEKRVNNSSQSIETEKFEVGDYETQFDNKELLSIATEQDNNKATMRLEHLKIGNEPENASNINCAPWFPLEWINQTPTADSMNSITNLESSPSDLQKKEGKVSKCVTKDHHDSFKEVITEEEKRRTMLKNLYATPFEEVSEEERAELRKRMLGYMD